MMKMLDNNQKYVVELLRASVVGDNVCTNSSSIDSKIVASIILKNGILLTVYPTIKHDPLAKQLCALLEEKYYNYLKNSVIMDSFGKKVRKSLTEAGFIIVMLKGWETRTLYSDITKREMNDIDILVKNYNYKRIRQAMAAIEFMSNGETTWMHDNFTNGKVTVEVHKRLTDDAKRIQQWERIMWNRARSVGENILQMSDEDFYIYHIVHMYTDFISGSFGLRRIADTWLLSQKKKNMNWDYIENTLKQFGMERFNARILQLSRSCFSDCDLDDNSALLLKYAFEAGIKGNGNSNKVSRVVRYSNGNRFRGKMYSVRASIFPSLSRMKALYPSLNKCILFLPFCWIHRTADHIHHLNKYRRQIDFSNIEEKEYEAMSDIFVAGGIKTQLK